MDSELQERLSGLSIAERLTLYVPLHPEAVERKAGSREVCKKSAKGRAEYVNRREFVWHVYDHRCVLCGFPVVLEMLTLDHRYGRGMNGSKRSEAVKDIIPAHPSCNIRKGSRGIVEGESCIECGHSVVIGGRRERECLRCDSQWQSDNR